MPAVHARPAIREDLGGEARVTPLELCFDLVFAFAITQVTGMISDDPSWAGLARGLLVLAVLWWCWAAYAWLTDTVDPDQGAARLVVFVAMAALLVVSLAVPGAFGDDALVFALAYLVVRVPHAALLVGASSEDGPLRAAVRYLLGPAMAGPVLLIAASAFDGAAQAAFWCAAIAVTMGWPLISGMEGWRLAPAHFAERHGLIVIIALGESIVAVGIGAAGLGLDADVIAGAVLAVGVSAMLWWAYFDVVAFVAEAHIAFRLRNVGTINRQQLVVAVALLAFVPAAPALPALASLSIVFALCAGSIAYEAIWLADARRRVRQVA